MKIKTYFKQAQEIELENGDRISVNAPEDMATDEKPLQYWEYTDGVFIYDKVQQEADNQAVINRERMSEIQGLLKQLDIKTMKFIDGDITAEEYEQYKQEKAVLRAEYRALETEGL